MLPAQTDFGYMHMLHPDIELGQVNKISHIKSTDQQTTIQAVEDNESTHVAYRS